MKKSIIFILLICTIVLTACSEEESSSKNNEEQTITDDKSVIVEKNESDEEGENQPLPYDESDFKRPLTDVEKMMLDYNGIYSGSNYSEEDLYKKIDQLPPNLTEQEYYDKLLNLLKEDYSSEVETLVNFDDVINVNLERPDENIDTTIKNIRYVILLDASGSMFGQINGITKMEAAKESIEEFAQGLPSDSSISLRAYGNKGSNKQEDKLLSCSSTEEVYSGNFNKEEFNKSLGSIQPSGWTPIALALESIKNDINDNEKVIVYVVSDGIETCGGDPVEVVKELKESGIDITVNIIGFDIDDNGQRLLKEVSDEGNGEFKNVNSQQELNKYLRQQYEVQQYKWSNWKDSGVEQATQISDEKKLQIVDIEDEIKNIANTEYEHLINAHAYLEKTFEESNIDFDEIASLINERYSEISKYARDTSESIRSNIMMNNSEEIRNYNEEGDNKVNENIIEKSKVNE